MNRKQIVVIGAGPAGMMAAGQAAIAGAKVTLLEKMDHPGIKLRITGKGRCNITNIAPLPEFIKHFGHNGRFLHSSFSRYFSQDLLDFLSSLGIETAAERGGRVFPTSNEARTIVEALLKWLQGLQVDLRTNAAVEKIILADSQVTGVRLRTHTKKADTLLTADRVILATGGASYPGTGSTGDGYKLAAACGHRIISVRPALVPLRSKGEIAASLQGLNLKNVRAEFFADGQSLGSEFGEMIFTHFGVSGPIILSLSRNVVDALQAKKKVRLSLDLKPALSEEKLDARLRREFDQHGKRFFRSILEELLPRKLIPVCIQMTCIPEDKLAHQITSTERKCLLAWLKGFELEIEEYLPFTQAIITAGGIHLKEVDPRTMHSRLVKGLYFAGEILDLDADTGGYNLQAAFSTGWMAGRAAAENLS